MGESWGGSEHHWDLALAGAALPPSPPPRRCELRAPGDQAEATFCPLPALVPVLGQVCYKSMPIYVTGSQSQTLRVLESGLQRRNFVLLTLMPHLIFHNLGNALPCQRRPQRPAGGSVTGIYVIRLGLES